jgi:hypothetical protein
MKNKELLINILHRNYNAVCWDYIDFFTKKHGYEFSSWVADEVGGIACFVEQYYFNFNNIVEDINNQYPKGKIFEHQDYEVECDYKGKTTINLRNYVMYGDFTEDPKPTGCTCDCEESDNNNGLLAGIDFSDVEKTLTDIIANLSKPKQ